MSRYKPKLDIQRAVKGIKIKMANTAERVNRAGQRVMEEEAEQVRRLASLYSPRKSGALENLKNWVVEKEASGPNRRNEFVVKLKQNVIARRYKTGRVVRLSKYAGWMHDGFYNLGKKSKQKARSLGFSTNNSGNSKHVGRLYLKRAANHRRAICQLKLLKAVSGELN